MVRLNDRPDMTLDVYRGGKTATQQQQLMYFIRNNNYFVSINKIQSTGVSGYLN